MRCALLAATFCLSTLLTLPVTTHAADKIEYQSPTTQQYVGLLAHWLHNDEDRNLKSNAQGLGALYGRQLSQHIWWETSLDYFKLPTDIAGLDDYSQYHLMTGLAYAFGDRKHFTPFVIAQLGAIKHDVEPSDDKDTNLGLSAGGGVIVPLFANGLRLRAEARYVFDSFTGDRGTDSLNQDPFGDWRASVGIELPFGVTKVVVREKTVVKEVVKTVVQTKEVPVVIKDTDADGVPDKRDDCPGTPAGAKVDAKGCLIANQRLVLKDILFELGSTRLTANSKTNLAVLADSLKSQKELQIEVAGYTDSTGRASTNLRLSQARAEAVRDFLVQQGVPADRLTAKGYGIADPVASNKTVSGRALNRRVELHLSSK